jgi:DsbC/DsbD-like thiol-disulfide interchange protein
MKLPALFLALGTSLAAVTAQAQSFDRVVQAEVLPGWRTESGDHMAALRITLNPGWKTYWRAPGDAGIPPLLDWSGSGNLESAEVTWPTPEVFSQNGMRSIGYTEELVLPVRVDPRRDGKAVRLKATLDIGVCRDICVPQRLRVSAKLTPDLVKRDPKITAAIANRPFSADEAGVKDVTCRISPIEDGLRVTARIKMPSAGAPEIAVMETGNPRLWVAEGKTHREGNTLVTQTEVLHGNAEPFMVDRSALRFTVLGKKHAVDISGCKPG